MLATRIPIAGKLRPWLSFCGVLGVEGHQNSWVVVSCASKD